MNIIINLCEKSVIFCYCCFWKMCFIDRKAYFKHHLYFFGNITVFYFSYLSLIDIDTIGNHVHNLHIIVDRNQEFAFFSLKPFQINKRKIGWKKGCQNVNVKSKNEKILDTGCNNTVTIPLSQTKNSATFRGFRRSECCFSQSLQLP